MIKYNFKQKDWSSNFDFDAMYDKLMNEDFFDTIGVSDALASDDEEESSLLTSNPDIDMFITVNVSSFIRLKNTYTQKRQFIEQIRDAVFASVPLCKYIYINKNDAVYVVYKARGKKQKMEIDNYSMNKKKIQECFEYSTDSENITILIKADIAVATKRDIATFLCSFNDTLNDMARSHVKRTAVSLESLKFENEDGKSASISSLAIDKINNDIKETESNSQIDQIFDVIGIKDFLPDELVDNLDEFTGSESGLSSDAKDFLYGMGIHISKKLYDIEEDDIEKVIIITLKNYSKLVIESINSDSEYKLKILTEAKSERETPSVQINSPFKSEEEAKLLKFMLDSKGNKFNELVIIIDNSRFDSMIHLNNVFIRTVRYSLTNMKYNNQWSLDNYMNVNNMQDSVLFQSDKSN